MNELNGLEKNSGIGLQENAFERGPTWAEKPGMQRCRNGENYLVRTSFKYSKKMKKASIVREKYQIDSEAGTKPQKAGKP